MTILLGALALLLLTGAGLAWWSGQVVRKVEAAVPPDGRFADVPGARIHFTDTGGGAEGSPALVMVHGLLGQMRNFAYDLAGRMAADHRVILIDRPGWGYSENTGAERPDIAAQARILADCIAALGLDRPVIVGHSMGGAVALALALDHPGAVRGLALIAPYTQPVEALPTPFRGLAVPRPLRRLVAWTLAVPIAVRTGAAKTAQVFDPDPAPADFGLRGGGLLGVRPKSFQSGAFEVAMAREAMAAQAPRYGELRLPVAILYGRDDALLDPELHGTDTASVIPGATCRMIEGGHMPLIVRPAEVEAWLRGALAAMA